MAEGLDILFLVRVPSGALSAEMRLHIQSNAAQLGAEVTQPIRFDADGSWTAAKGLSRRAAQALRRRLTGLGIKAAVEEHVAVEEHGPVELQASAAARPTSMLPEGDDFEIGSWLDDDEEPDDAPLAKGTDDTEGGEPEEGHEILSWFADDVPDDDGQVDSEEPAESPFSPRVSVPGPAEEDLFDLPGFEAASKPVLMAAKASNPIVPAVSPRSRPAIVPASSRGLASAMDNVADRYSGGATPAKRSYQAKNEIPWMKVGIALAIIAALVTAVVLLVMKAASSREGVAERPVEPTNAPKIVKTLPDASRAFRPPTPDASEAEPEEPDTASETDREAARDLFEQGKAAFQLQQYDQCIGLMEAATTMDPTLGEAFTWILKSQRALAPPPEEKPSQPEVPKEPKLIIITPGQNDAPPTDPKKDDGATEDGKVSKTSSATPAPSAGTATPAPNGAQQKPKLIVIEPTPQDSDPFDPRKPTEQPRRED